MSPGTKEPPVRPLAAEGRRVFRFRGGALRVLSSTCPQPLLASRAGDGGPSTAREHEGTREE
jgi:hypothetical protein